MSMCSSFIYGFGFHCGVEDQKLINFIKNHKETFCQSKEEFELYAEISSCTNKIYLEDLFEDYSCDATGITGMGAVIANIMFRETGIRFIYCLEDEDCDTPASIVFSEGYPWQENDIEKKLTEEKLLNICKKYMDELGIIDQEPDYLTLEYFC
jgi:hypothetical protein